MYELIEILSEINVISIFIRMVLAMILCGAIGIGFYSAAVIGMVLIMLSLWGQEFNGDTRTVDVHIRRLRMKIEKNAGDPEFIKTKWGVGYYFQA